MTERWRGYQMHIPGLRVIWGGRIMSPRPEPSTIYDTPVLWIDTDNSVACFVDPSDGEIIDTSCVDSHRFYVEQSSYAMPDRIDRVEAMHAAYEQVKAELLGTLPPMHDTVNGEARCLHCEVRCDVKAQGGVDMPSIRAEVACPCCVVALRDGKRCLACMGVTA